MWVLLPYDSQCGILHAAFLQIGDTPLSLCSQRGHLETKRLLLDHGADPNLAVKVSFTWDNNHWSVILTIYIHEMS